MMRHDGHSDNPKPCAGDSVKLSAKLSAKHGCWAAL